MSKTIFDFAQGATQERAEYTNPVETEPTRQFSVDVMIMPDGSRISVEEWNALHPQSVFPSVTLNPLPATITAGAALALTASASNAESALWSYSADGTTGWVDVTTKGFTVTPTVDGETLESAASKSTSVVGDTGHYKATFTNEDGSIDTDIVAVTVNAAVITPVITVQPTNQTAAAGAALSLTASATSAESAVWQYSADGTTGWVDVATKGFTVTPSGTTTLKIDAAKASSVVGDTGSYRAVFTSSTGATTTSNVVTATVTA